MPLPETIYGRNVSILITGASSGIGAALAEHLASHGGRIALAARRVERLEEVADRVRRAGAAPIVLPVDVTDHDQVLEAHRHLVEEQGPVEVAFLNAGVGDQIPLRRFDARRIKHMYAVNVFGVLSWIEAILPGMQERGRGIIAATSSLAALRGFPGGTAYASTKAALSSLLDGYRLEARRMGIQLTLVEPGFIESEMTAQVKSAKPFLMDTRDAAARIAAGVAEGEAIIRFPWQLTAALQVARHLPVSLWDRIGAAFMGKRR